MRTDHLDRFRTQHRITLTEAHNHMLGVAEAVGEVTGTAVGGREILRWKEVFGNFTCEIYLHRYTEQRFFFFPHLF